MERVAYGGETRNPKTGKWVPSRMESWRCVTAWRTYQAARSRALAELDAEHGRHLRMRSYRVTDKGREPLHA